MGFRKDFVWGTATAAFQIEGAAFRDGKGPSNWDIFTHSFLAEEDNGGLDVGGGSPVSAVSGDTADVACDHYDRWREDVELMSKLGAGAYRFSISWPRLIPDGTGEINPKGAKFYGDLVDGLTERGIEPYVTLFHWDYPQALEEKGAWTNPDSPLWFEAYAAAVAKLFGNRVKHYITFNEPQVFFHCGYRVGSHAPGKRLSEGELVRGAHNVLLAHGLAVKAIREYSPEAEVGIAPCGRAYMPADLSPENVEAARKKYFGYGIEDFTKSVGFWSDAAILGEYSPTYLEKAAKYLPGNFENDLKNIISAPLDFYCQNLYNGYYGVSDAKGGFTVLPRKKNVARTAMHANSWYVTPDVLYWAPKFLTERYRLPFYISENGAAMADCVSLDGKVHDPGRIDYIHRYLLSLKRLAEEGYDIRGYFVWSLLDNFEWTSGYADRMGLVWVDYETGERLLKDSFEWYKSVIASNGENL